MRPLAVALLVLLAGCGSVRPVRGGGTTSMAEANAALQDRLATLVLTDGGRIRGARGVTLAPAVTTWRSADGFRRHEMPTERIARVEVQPGNPWTVAAVAGGLGAGVLTFALLYDDCGLASLVAFMPPLLAATAVSGATTLGGLARARRAAPEPIVVYQKPRERPREPERPPFKEK